MIHWRRNLTKNLQVSEPVRWLGLLSVVRPEFGSKSIESKQSPDESKLGISPTTVSILPGSGRCSAESSLSFQGIDLLAVSIDAQSVSYTS